MYTINLNKGKIEYENSLSIGGVRLAQLSVPAEHETYTNKTTAEELAEIPLVNRLSKRNYKQTYIIPVHLNSVLLNLIPEKIIITDSTIREIIDTNFNYFVDDDITDGLPVPFSLVDGIIFRCVGEGVKELKDYTYYLMNNGVAQKIPNYQTLEVMLTERGMTYQSIRVLEESQCSAILGNEDSPLPDNSSTWSPSLSSNIDFSNFEDLKGAAADAGAIAGAAAAEADKNIKAVKAEADAAKAQAEAAQAASQASAAQASAAQAASQAAIAQADAAKAEAEAAKAEAEQLKAEAEAAKAEAEAEKNKKT